MSKRKPVAVNYEVIDADRNREPYAILASVRNQFHDDELSGARIALAWRKRTKQDVDGHLVLGRCVKVSDLQKEFANFDFIIVLNREVWEDLRFTPEQKAALLDHELCHAAPALDEETGERKFDERGRAVWRIRKHDIEEFQSVVAHHGCYKRDLETFARTLLKNKKHPLFEGETTMSLGVVGEDGKLSIRNR